MAHPLDGVKAKIDRAVEHARALRDEMKPLDPAEFYRAVEKPRGQPKHGRLWVDAVLEVVKEPDPKLGVIAGDWAHNLRGALDHTVYQLALLDTKRMRADGTFFPIARTESEYLDAGPCSAPSLRDRALNGIAEKHRAVIDAVQPYVGRNRSEAVSHTLAVLNAFTNTDKHRLIHPAAVRPMSVTSTVTKGGAHVEVKMPAGPRALRQNAKVYSFQLSGITPGEDVSVETYFTFGIGFGNRGLMPIDLIEITKAVVEYLNTMVFPIWAE